MKGVGVCKWQAIYKYKHTNYKGQANSDECGESPVERSNSAEVEEAGKDELAAADVIKITESSAAAKDHEKINEEFEYVEGDCKQK